MSEVTQVQQEVYDTAKAIGQILDEHRLAFEALVNLRPNAGIFPTAQWLELVVDDRRNAIYEHYKRLDTIFENMSTKLDTVADDLFAADADNAKVLQDFMDMKRDIDAELEDYDVNTEKDQGNFTPHPEDDSNAHDGQGYDDNENNSRP